LYSVPKNEERHSKFEIAITFLQENLIEILRYFHLTKQKKSDDTEKGLIYFKEDMNNNLFSDFLKLTSFLLNLVSKNKFTDDYKEE
jgi:methionyl-tRNA synthetase